MLWSKGCGFAGWGSSLRGEVISYIITVLCQGCQNRLVHIKEARQISIPRHPCIPSSQVVLQWCVSCCCSWKSAFSTAFGNVFSQVSWLCWGSSRESTAVILTLHEAFPVANCLLCSQSLTSRTLKNLTAFHNYFKVKNSIELHLESSRGLKEVIVPCR